MRSGQRTAAEPTEPTVLARRRPGVRQTALVLLSVMVAVGAAEVALRAREPQYAASSRLVVTPLSRDNDSLVGLPLLRDLGDPIRTIETAAAVLESPSFAERAASKLGADWSTSAVQAAVVVAPLAQTNVLEVRATTTSPAASARVANAYAAAVLTLRSERLSRATELEVASAESQLAEPGVVGTGTAGALRERISELRLLGRSGDPTIALAQEALAPQGSSDTPRWMVLGFAALSAVVLDAALLLLGGARRPLVPASAVLSPVLQPRGTVTRAHR